MKILFDTCRQPISDSEITQKVSKFKPAYKTATNYVIKNSQSGLNRTVFRKNVAYLMPRFKMTRKGVFEGVEIAQGKVQDPNRIISACWAEVGFDIVQLRSFIDNQNLNR